MRLPLLILIVLVAGLAGALKYSPPPPATNQTPQLKSIELDGQELIVELATTPAQKTAGLGGRPGLPQNQGLLFVFDKPEFYSFWMKDMRFPIDIIWIGADGRVISVEPNISPDTFPQKFTPPIPARYILEVNTGFAEQYAIGPGTLFAAP